MLRRVALVRTDVSEEPSASFIRVTRTGELGTILAAISWCFPSSPTLVTLMKEALGSSETSVLTKATRRNIPEDTILHRDIAVYSGPPLAQEIATPVAWALTYPPHKLTRLPQVHGTRYNCCWGDCIKLAEINNTLHMKLRCCKIAVEFFTVNEMRALENRRRTQVDDKIKENRKYLAMSTSLAMTKKSEGRETEIMIKIRKDVNNTVLWDVTQRGSCKNPMFRRNLALPSSG
jgi:hypothetical protein